MAKSTVEAGIGAMAATFAAILGVAVIAILVSQRAQTAAVIRAFSEGGSELIKAAVSPVAN